MQKRTGVCIESCIWESGFEEYLEVSELGSRTGRGSSSGIEWQGVGPRGEGIGLGRCSQPIQRGDSGNRDTDATVGEERTFH